MRDLPRLTADAPVADAPVDGSNPDGSESPAAGGRPESAAAAAFDEATPSWYADALPGDLRDAQMEALRASHVPAASDLLLVVLAGDAELSDGWGRVQAYATSLDVVRLPAGGRRTTALTNRLAAPCTLLVVESQMRSLVDSFGTNWRIED